MKRSYNNIFLSSLIVLFSTLFMSCGQQSSDSSDDISNSLNIVGTIGSITINKSSVSTTNEIHKVLIYRDFGNADISEIDENGSFSINVDRKPCGLVFLDSADLVVGYLSLDQGIETLPLSMVDESVGTIDLQNINFINGVGTPQHNPIEVGGEMEMNDTERAAFRLQSTLFSAIIRNLDMNNDNIIDVLSDSPYWLRFGVDFNGGAPSNGDPGELGPLPALNVFHFNFKDDHIAIDTPKAVLTTPDASTFTCDEARDLEYHWVLQNNWSSLQAGNYLISYGTDNNQVSFNVDSPLDSENYIVAAYLWYEMNETTMYKVHWKWRMLNGADIDASKLLQNDVILQFQLSDGTKNNFLLSAADTECVVNIDSSTLQQLTQILVSSQDLFGNWQPTFYNIDIP